VLQLGERPSVAAESLRSREPIPSARILSSRDYGWTSLLVDVHYGHKGAKALEPYTSLPTPDQEIGVALSGRYASQYLYGGRWRRGVYEPGALCIHRRSETRRVRFEPIVGVDSSTAMLYLPKGQVLDAAEHLRRAGQRERYPDLRMSVDRDPLILHATHSLIRAMQQGVDDLYAETTASWLAVHLITRHGGVDLGGSRKAGAFTDARLSRVIEYMSARLAEPMTLAELAAQACISKFHFVRLFRARMGQTPHSFLTDLRLETASRMLITTDLAIASVGIACGYPVASHFSSAFAAKYGATPRTFRARFIPAKAWWE
jgi:AraC family transcriptional regulator